MVGDSEDEHAIWVNAIDHVVGKPPERESTAAVGNHSPGSRELEKETGCAVKLSKEVAAQPARLGLVIQGNFAQLLISSGM